MKKKNLAFTLAEVLIVIGIIGVVAALTLPNLNHATGDKETVTRLQKAYSILNEANDRAVAIYGPISTWKNCHEEEPDSFIYCYMNRIGEFLKVSKSCNELNVGTYASCDSLVLNNMPITIAYQLQDGITFVVDGANSECTSWDYTTGWNQIKSICFDELKIDINGLNKGKNEGGLDIFRFSISDDLGILPYMDGNSNIEDSVGACLGIKNDDTCTWWVLEYGNLDYLKVDGEGKCNDSNIILDGVTNTSCH